MKIAKSKLKRIIKEELFKEAGRTLKQVDLQETGVGKGTDAAFGRRTLKQVGREKRAEAGMPPHPRYSENGDSASLDAIKTIASDLIELAGHMEDAPSHDPVSSYAKFVASKGQELDQAVSEHMKEMEAAEAHRKSWPSGV